MSIETSEPAVAAFMPPVEAETANRPNTALHGSTSRRAIQLIQSVRVLTPYELASSFESLARLGVTNKLATRCLILCRHFRSGKSRALFRLAGRPLLGSSLRRPAPRKRLLHSCPVWAGVPTMCHVVLFLLAISCARQRCSGA